MNVGMVLPFIKLITCDTTPISIYTISTVLTVVAHVSQDDH